MDRVARIFLLPRREDTTADDYKAIQQVSNVKDLDGECSPLLFRAFTTTILAWVVVVIEFEWRVALASSFFRALDKTDFGGAGLLWRPSNFITTQFSGDRSQLGDCYQFACTVGLHTSTSTQASNY